MKCNIRKLRNGRNQSTNEALRCLRNADSVIAWWWSLDGRDAAEGEEVVVGAFLPTDLTAEYAAFCDSSTEDVFGANGSDFFAGKEEFGVLGTVIFAEIRLQYYVIYIIEMQSD